MDIRKNADPAELVYLRNTFDGQQSKCETESDRKLLLIRMEKSRNRVVGNALNNITFFLPKAEYTLLGKVKDGSGVFDPKAVETYLGDAYVDGYALVGLKPEVVFRAGINRDLDNKLRTFNRVPIVFNLKERITEAQRMQPARPIA